MLNIWMIYEKYLYVQSREDNLITYNIEIHMLLYFNLYDNL